MQIYRPGMGKFSSQNKSKSDQQAENSDGGCEDNSKASFSHEAISDDTKTGKSSDNQSPREDSGSKGRKQRGSRQNQNQQGSKKFNKQGGAKNDEAEDAGNQKPEHDLHHHRDRQSSGEKQRQTSGDQKKGQGLAGAESNQKKDKVYPTREFRRSNPRSQNNKGDKMESACAQDQDPPEAAPKKSGKSYSSKRKERQQMKEAKKSADPSSQDGIMNLPE